MSRHHVRRSTPLCRSFRALQIAGMLDVPLPEKLVHELVAEVPGLDDPWTIGALVGPSGIGKTTLARAAFGDVDEPRSWPEGRAIVDVLGDGSGTRSTTIKDITRVLIGVGLGSVPTWLKPYQVLSGGERFRADVARAVLHSKRRVIVIDEFTSTLDRNLAKTAAMAVARLVRKGMGSRQLEVAQGEAEVGCQRMDLGPRLVVLTCHTDVLPWLAPDWVVELNSLTAPRLVHRPFPQPKLEIAVARVRQSLWRQFAGLHYLSNGLAASATCYAAVLPCAGDGEITARPVAFCAVAATLGWKKSKHIARLVTLPEFQGLSIGGRLLDEVARRESQRGTRITITASHPAVLGHCSGSPRWQFVEVKKTGSTRQRYQGREVRCSAGRAVASFRYTGG